MDLHRGATVRVTSPGMEGFSAEHGSVPVPVGIEGEIVGRWPDTGPDLREGWWMLKITDSRGDVWVPVLPRYVEVLAEVAS